MGKLMLSKTLFQKGKETIKNEINKFNKKPKVALLIIGSDPSSQKYISLKNKDFQGLGIECEVIRYQGDISPDELANKLEKLNADDKLTGYVLQLPLPFSLSKVAKHISKEKDIDAFQYSLPISFNLKKTNLSSILYPCTAKAVIYLLKAYNLLESNLGKKVVIVGNGFTAGRPLSNLFLYSDYTLTICNKFTDNLKEYTRNADLLISAAGSPALIDADSIKIGAVVINIGLNMKNGVLTGDVDEKSIDKKYGFLAPSIGSIGLLTRLMVLENTLLLFKRYQCQIKK